MGDLACRSGRPPPISAGEVAAAERLIENALGWLRYDLLYHEPIVGPARPTEARDRARAAGQRGAQPLLEALLADVLRASGIGRAAARLVLDLMRARRAELQEAGIELPSSAKPIEQRLMARDKSRQQAPE